MQKETIELNQHNFRLMTQIVDAHGNPISSKESTVTEVKQIDKSDILFIQTPIFILFAEYLGFVSLLIPYAEDWCNPTKAMPKQWVKTLLEREAKSIYDDMLKIWTEDEINKLYRNFYPCALEDLELDLNEKRAKYGDNLPF